MGWEKLFALSNFGGEWSLRLKAKEAKLDCSWAVKSYFLQALMCSPHTVTYVYSVQFSCSVVSDSLQPCGLQHPRLPCLSPNPGACSDSCLSSHWYCPTISSSADPVSSSLQSFLASGSFPVSQFLTLGAKVLELQLQHQSFQWIFRTDIL